MADKVRQAVVIVHGMGEQKPLDALNGFIVAALPSNPQGQEGYYSRPDNITKSYESRRYLAPRYAPEGKELNAQTEFYEYHWAHLMQGNRLDDMWPTVRRMLLQLPTRIPSGLRVIWVLFWALLGLAVWAFIDGPFSRIDLSDIGAETLIRALLGGGVVAFGLLYLLTRVLPRSITKSFVDVVRYLDTSPRSYDVRKNIRKGMVELLQGLHDSGRYQRIVVAAHSLGAFIAYDGITYLWGQMNALHLGPADPVPGNGQSPDGLAELERAASKVHDEPSAHHVDDFRKRQRELWLGLRKQGNPWLITDFVSLGTPMYFADRLYTKNRRTFDRRVRRWELPTAPPEPEGARYNNINNTPLWFSFKNGGRRVLYHGAPFAVVRWTNMWFPAAFGFFGDWFGGSLAPLFGHGVKDIMVEGNNWRRMIPGYAHALYFKFAQDASADSVTTHLRRALDLASTVWLRNTLEPPDPDSDTA